MSAARYFAPRYFPRRYFGGASLIAPGTPGKRPLVASFADREFRATFLDHPTMLRHVTITIGETLEPIRVLLEHTEDGVVQPLPLGGATVTAFLKGTESGAEKHDIVCAVVTPRRPSRPTRTPVRSSWIPRISPPSWSTTTRCASRPTTAAVWSSGGRAPAIWS